jgi:hypothetical protein
MMFRIRKNSLLLILLLMITNTVILKSQQIIQSEENLKIDFYDSENKLQTGYAYISSKPELYSKIGQEYIYTPNVYSNIDNAVFKFSIDKSPDDVQFNQENGQLIWTASSVGMFSFRIILKVTVDGIEIKSSMHSWKIYASDCDKPAILSGIINDEEGNPIRFGEIGVFSKEQDSLIFGTRYSWNDNFFDGKFQVPNLGDGEYFILVKGHPDHNGTSFYETQWYDNTFDFFKATPVVIECGEIVEMSFTLKKLEELKYYTVSGKVYDAETGEKINSALINFVDLTIEPEHLKDSYIYPYFDGMFEKTNLYENHEYLIYVRADGSDSQNDSIWNLSYVPQYYDNAYSRFNAKKIKIIGDMTDLDFPMYITPNYENRISGSVVNSQDEPFKNAKVEVFLVDAEGVNLRYLHISKSNLVNIYSEFMITYLIPGEYVILVTPEDSTLTPGYYLEGGPVTYTWEDATRIKVDATSQIVNIKIMLDIIQKIDGPGKIKGGVNNIGGIIKSGDEVQSISPISEANVYLISSNNIVCLTTLTDNYGSFELNDLAAGEYTLIISKIGFYSLTSIINIEENEEVNQTFTLIKNHLTSVGNYSESDINLIVYPNPAVDFINITTKDLGIAYTQFEIYDILGKEVYRGSLNGNLNTKINISFLKKGTYFCNIIGGSNKLKARFIKN